MGRQSKQHKPTTQITQDEARLTATKTHLESIILTMVEAINTRDFDATSPSYRHFSTSYIGESERPPGAVDVELAPLQANLDSLRRIAEVWPGYQMRVFNFTTDVDEKAGKAVMYFEGETRGWGGEKLVLPSIGVLEFLRFGEVWKAVCLRGMRAWLNGVS